jgi:hypothetical protein
MKLLITLVLTLVMTGCQANTTKQQLKDNNINTTNVSNNANIGKGQQYGGKRSGYGQVKKIPPGNAVPPTNEVPNDNGAPPLIGAPPPAELTFEQKIEQVFANHRVIMNALDAPKVCDFSVSSTCSEAIGNFIHKVYLSISYEEGGAGSFTSSYMGVSNDEILAELEKATGYDMEIIYFGTSNGELLVKGKL